MKIENLIEEKDVNEIDWDNIDACLYENKKRYDLAFWQELYEKDGLPAGVL